MKKISLLFLFLLTAALAQAQFPTNNKSVHFSNATDEGISIPNNNLMNFTNTQSFTIEAWVKTNDAVNCMMIFAEQYCPGPSTGVLFYISNGKVGIGLDANTATYSNVASNCSIADGNWHHVVAVRNVATDSLYVYIDGVENGRALDITTGTLTDANASYWVGRRTWCGTICNYYGDIDEVRVWHKAKTQSEIIAEKDMQLTGNETSLKLYYNFNAAANGNGQTVVNNCSLTGSALNGTIVGTATEPSFASAQPSGIFVPCDPVLWLKADSAVFSNAGTTLATNGQTVQQWNDVSGNGYHTTQSNAALRPEWQANAINGKPALSFYGALGTYYLNNTVQNLVAAGAAKTLFIVARKRCASANTVAAFTLRRSSLLAAFQWATYGSSMVVYSDGVTGTGLNNAFISDSVDQSFQNYPAILTYHVPSTNAPLQFFKNGQQLAVTQSGFVNTENGTSGFTVGNREDISGGTWDGWIAEIIVYNRALSTIERQQVESYLSNKYSLQNPGLPACNKVLWLKADSAAYTDAGITLATNGQTVQQWNDVSGNAFHCSQPTSSKRPTWQAKAFNGKPALWFDGVNGNYWLENTVNTPVATPGIDRTYFVVAKAACNATGYKGGHLFTNRLTPNASTLEFVENGSGIFHAGNLCCNHPQVTNQPFSEGQTKPFIGTWRTNGTGTNIDFWFNGASKTTANANFVSDGGAAGYCVGDRRDAFQFQNPTGGYDWQGHIAEIIVYDRALTDLERAQVESYLSNKYSEASPSTLFNSAPTLKQHSNAILDDSYWKHSYSTTASNQVIASIKDYCLDLGTRIDTVYVEPNALTINTNKVLRRHYVIETSLNPTGTKRVRLYYTDDDFANLQQADATLTSHSQLAVTKYDGPNEDGVFSASAGAVTFIPSSQITTGQAFGQRYLEFDVDSLSEFWIYKGTSVLPVQLKYFSVEKTGAIASLQWLTANEDQVSGYTVEQSHDGNRFVSLGYVPAKNKEENTYKFFDDLGSWKGEVVYYRLKIHEQQGAFTHSHTIALKVASTASVTLAPNPTSQQFQLIAPSSYTDMYISDLAGRVLLHYDIAPSRSYDVKSLSKGMYLVRLIGKQKDQLIKLVVQ